MTVHILGAAFMCASDFVDGCCRYLLLDAETGEQTPLPAIGKDTVAAVVPLPGGEFMLALDGQTQVFGA
jgi:hypothetical protein